MWIVRTHIGFVWKVSSFKGLGFSSSRGSSASPHGFGGFGLSIFVASKPGSDAGGVGVVILGGVSTGVAAGVPTGLVAPGISKPTHMKQITEFRLDWKPANNLQTRSSFFSFHKVFCILPERVLKICEDCTG